MTPGTSGRRLDPRRPFEEPIPFGEKRLVFFSLQGALARDLPEPERDHERG